MYTAVVSAKRWCFRCLTCSMRCLATIVVVFVVILLSVFVFGLIFIVNAPSLIDPVVIGFEKTPYDHPIKIVQNAKKVCSELIAPESFCLNSKGDLFTTVGDGSIVQLIDIEKGIYETVAYSSPWQDRLLCEGHEIEAKCGRPLGMQFTDNDELIFCEPYQGLLKFSQDFKTRKLLTDFAAGRKIQFCNSVVIQGPSVFFTDSSKKFAREEVILDILEGDEGGRLLKYDLETGTTSVILDRLAFPNGIATDTEGEHLFICSSTHQQLIKYNIKSTKIVGKLPLVGLCDNVKYITKWGAFAVTITVNRTKVEEFLYTQGIGALMRRIMGSKNEPSNFIKNRRDLKSMVMKVSPNLQILDVAEFPIESPMFSEIYVVPENNKHSNAALVGSRAKNGIYFIKNNDDLFSNTYIIKKKLHEL